MVSERINGIVLMHVHHEIVPDIEREFYFLLKTEDLVLRRHSVHPLSFCRAVERGMSKPPPKFLRKREGLDRVY